MANNSVCIQYNHMSHKVRVLAIILTLVDCVRWIWSAYSLDLCVFDA